MFFLDENLFIYFIFLLLNIFKIFRFFVPTWFSHHYFVFLISYFFSNILYFIVCVFLFSIWKIEFQLNESCQNCLFWHIFLQIFIFFGFFCCETRRRIEFVWLFNVLYFNFIFPKRSRTFNLQLDISVDANHRFK